MNKLDVTQTKVMLDLVGQLVIDAVAIGKDGLTIYSLPKIVKVWTDVQGIAEEIKPVMAELNDLNADELKELAAAALALIQKITIAIAN